MSVPTFQVIVIIGTELRFIICNRKATAIPEDSFG